MTEKVGAGGALRTWDSADKTPAQQVGAAKTLPTPLRIRGQVTATIPKAAHPIRPVIPGLTRNPGFAVYSRHPQIMAAPCPSPARPASPASPGLPNGYPPVAGPEEGGSVHG